MADPSGITIRPIRDEGLAALGQQYGAAGLPPLSSLDQPIDPMTGLPIGAPRTEAPNRPLWMMEPDLTAQQTGNVDLPKGAAFNENNQPYYPDTGEAIKVVRRPGVLPFAMTPDGLTLAMPKAADVLSNLMGGGVPLKGGEVALGAGPIRRIKSPEQIQAAVDRAVEGATARQALSPEQIKIIADHAEARAAGQPYTRSTDLPNLRELPVDEAVRIARDEPHLLKAGEQSAGYYVGGPREMGSKRALTNRRNWFDDYIGKDPRGADWYDRYRAGVSEVTGGNPEQSKWMSNQEAQWSAGVSPEGELGFTLKENNASLAGMPVKSARPAQHAAHEAAIAAQDPDLYQLGKKTGQYANLIEPRPDRTQGATGVNDFRHAVNWGYTEPSGAPQRNSIGGAGHRFLDYETALAVDRANKANLGGRNDWTGERLQAAPWVRQKAEALMERNSNLTYDQAFERANTTIADFFPKHTAYATHEAMPGADTGHLPASVGASDAERAAFSADPRSTWATAPGGRDAIYSGMGIEGTGNYMRVRPSQEMQGFYPTPAGPIETNPGMVAMPLVGLNAGKVKSVAPADKALLNAGEAVRGYVDAQNASAWHKPLMGGAPGQSNSLFTPMQGKASVQQMTDLQKLGARYGLTDVADTGEGVTMTRFYPEPDKLTTKQLGKEGLARDIEAITGSIPKRAKVDSGYIDYVPRWQEGVGSGAATREMLSHVNATPEIRAAINNNAEIPKAALARLERDAEYAAKWGATREDIQNARRIIGDGSKGWVDRLEDALKKGAIALPVVAALLAPAVSERRGE